MFSALFMEVLGILWPILGISCVVEFLRKDKWGWGGIFFHLFTLYCMIYYSIMTVMAIFAFSGTFHWWITFLLHFAIALIGVASYLFYYD
ncbi:MAG: hypothetical protein ACOC44_11200 [Promethearchaeia archaeon]